MTSTERVSRVLRGQTCDRTPILGWVSANLTNEINAAFGSVAAFEDKYEFDCAHIFGGPGPFFDGKIAEIRAANGEVTPSDLLELPLTDPDRADCYANVASAIKFHKQRGRFCYMQTPGFFEQYNGAFGIEDQLCWLGLYKDEIAELYRRQADWNIRFASNCIDCGADMIHISDDWGSQNSLLFSPELWRELIYPNMKRVVDFVKSRGKFVSLHSDGCVSSVLDGIADLGFDCVHPWQESANMPYSLWLDSYADKFAIMGGICIQTTLGFGDMQRLEREIKRVFRLLRDKRWICCTTHFVQNHCSIEELTFAFDLIYKLARGLK